MTAWTPAELDAIAGTDDFHIAPFREDGSTLGTLTWIWSVVVDGAVYVRAYNGTGSRWYRAARSQGAGRITAGGVEKDVTFTPIDDPQLNDRIDAAYEAKYGTSPYYPPMVTAKTRAATERPPWGRKVRVDTQNPGPWQRARVRIPSSSFWRLSWPEPSWPASACSRRFRGPSARISARRAQAGRRL